MAGSSRGIRGAPDDVKREFEERYTSGETPWDTGVPNAELLRTLEEGGLPGRTLLEMGCGTGTNAVELARRGYEVTAIDLSETAVGRARDRARRAGVRVDFRQGDLTRTELGGPFDAVFDLGLYHGIRLRDLPGFLSVLRRLTRPGTRWLSITGNAKEPLPDGPPVVSEEEFRSELGALFSFVKVREFRLEISRPVSPLAWSILMERR